MRVDRGLAARASCATLGTRFVWAADELYLQAGAAAARRARAYEGFAIAEDGVGLVRRFDGWLGAARCAARPRRLARPAPVTVVTGEMFAPRLRALLDESARGKPQRASSRPSPTTGSGAASAWPGCSPAGHPVQLAPGAGRELGDAVLVPAVAVRDGAGVFLDDLAPADLAPRSARPSSRSSRRPRPSSARWSGAGRGGARRRRSRCARSSPSWAGRMSASPRSSTGSSVTGARSCATCLASRATASTARWPSSAGRPPSSTPAASSPSTDVRPRGGRARQVLIAIEEADLIVFVVDGRAGITAARRGDRVGPARSDRPVIARREQGGRAGAGSLAGRGLSPGLLAGAADLRRARPRRGGAARGGARPRARRRRRARLGHARGHHRAPQCRQVLPRECRARPRARPRARRARHDARHGGHARDVSRPPVRADRHGGHPAQGQGVGGAREARRW